MSRSLRAGGARPEVGPASGGRGLVVIDASSNRAQHLRVRRRGTRLGVPDDHPRAIATIVAPATGAWAELVADGANSVHGPAGDCQRGAMARRLVVVAPGVIAASAVVWWFSAVSAIVTPTTSPTTSGPVIVGADIVIATVGHDIVDVDDDDDDHTGHRPADDPADPDQPADPDDPTRDRVVDTDHARRSTGDEQSGERRDLDDVGRARRRRRARRDRAGHLRARRRDHPGHPRPAVADAPRRRPQDHRAGAHRRRPGVRLCRRSVAHRAPGPGRRRAPSGQRTSPPGLDRTDIDSALNFELDPAYYAAGDATFTAQVWSAGFTSIADEPNTQNNLLTEHVEFQVAEVPTVWLMALDDGSGPGDQVDDVTGLLGFAPVAFDDLIDFLPIASVDFQAYPLPVGPGPEAAVPGLWDVSLDIDLDPTANSRRNEPNIQMERDRDRGRLPRRRPGARCVRQLRPSG